VPQDSGLFPHLKVRANIGYPLKAARLCRSRQKEEIDRLADSLEIGPLLDRRIHGLSGGERQKVALARALAARPRLLVLDEPVSALDEPTRKETCDLLTRIADQYDLTALHICHSRTEAEQVADRVGILYGGKLVQVGTITEVERSPAQPAVARLLNV
jgi:ABC-type sugar transport system ATPase subunit